MVYVLSHIFEGGKIIFSQETYEFTTALLISKNISLIGTNSTFKRKNTMAGNYLFTIANGIILNISDLTLNAGIDVTNGANT